MNPLTILQVALRHSDTLYYLLQQKQQDYEKENGSSATGHEKVWNCQSAGQLREKLADIDRHLQVHHRTSGKSLEESVSGDLFYVIAHSLNAIKVYLFSVVNMSSPYFRADSTTPGTMQAQIAEIISIVDDVKARLNSCGVSSDVVQNVTTVFDTNITELSETFRNAASTSFDDMYEPICQNVDVFRRVVQLAENLRHNSNDANRVMEGDADSDNDDGASSGSGNVEGLFALIPDAAKELMDELSARGGDYQTRYNLLQQMTHLWTGWQVDRQNILYDVDEFDDKLCIGEGATAVVFAGFLKTNGENARLPVAVKTKQMTLYNIPDALRELFLHLMAQHHCIVTLYGMWYPKPTARQSLMIVERMHGTLAHALEHDEKKVDKIAVLRDTAAALAHLHDRGIVHRDVKPDNVLLNEDCTKAKLSDFGSSRRRSVSMMTTTGAQQVGTPLYMAPEIRENPRCKTSPHMDCWAFGLLMCEVMNATERNTFVGGHHGDLHGAANAWADGIRDGRVKVAATACVQREAKHRPVMREVYLHLAGAVVIGEGLGVQRAVVTGEAQNDGVGKMVSNEVKSESAGAGGVSDDRRVNTSGESQEIAGRNWEKFLEISPNYMSKSVEISVANETEAEVEVCRTHADGQPRSALRVERSTMERLTKTAEEKGTFFVLRDSRTHAFRAAFVAKQCGRSVTVGQNYVHIRGFEENYANKGGAPWPLLSAASAKPVALTVDNKWRFDICVARVDSSGSEKPLVEEVEGSSKWTGHIAGESVLVFRYSEPGHSTYDRAFVCAVCVRTASPSFTVILDEL